MPTLFSESRLRPPVGLTASLTAPLPRDVIAFARSTYPVLRDTYAKDIVVMGFGIDWEGWCVEIDAATLSQVAPVDAIT